MMTAKAQLVIAICLIIALGVILNMVRRRSLELKYALSWLAGIVFVLIIDMVPTLMNKLAWGIGIYDPVSFILMLGIIFALAIIFVLTVSLSRMSERVRQLTQAVALSNETVERLSQQQDDGKENP